MTYVMFFVIYTNGGMASFQYEFKDKVQCENAVKVMEKRFSNSNVKGYCQEVRK